MLIIAIITGLITLICGITGIVRYKNSFNNQGVGWGVLSGIFGFIWAFALLTSINVSPGTQHYTGYIYTTSNQFGYTSAQIRYSQNAGADSQPSICVASNSKAAQELVAVAGTNTKVNITVPSFFYFAENPFACGTTKTTVTTVN